MIKNLKELLLGDPEKTEADVAKEKALWDALPAKLQDFFKSVFMFPLSHPKEPVKRSFRVVFNELGGVAFVKHLETFGLEIVEKDTAEERRLLLNFIYELTLAEHQGDILRIVYATLNRLSIDDPSFHEVHADQDAEFKNLRVVLQQKFGVVGQI